MSILCPTKRNDMYPIRDDAPCRFTTQIKPIESAVIAIAKTSAIPLSNLSPGLVDRVNGRLSKLAFKSKFDDFSKGSSPLKSIGPAPLLYEFLHSTDQANTIITRSDRASWGKVVQQLNLQNTRIDNAGLQNLLCRTPNLQVLTLERSEALTVDGLDHLEGVSLKSLTLLKFSDAPQKLIKLDRLIHFSINSGLESLFLDCYILDKELLQIAQLTSLRRLALTGSTDCSDIGFKALSTLSCLEVLDLRLSPIAEEGFTVIAQLPLLKTLKCVDCINITDVCLERFPPNSSLEFLNLEGCTKISDAGLSSIAKLSSLITLNLSGYLTIEGSGLQELARLSQLRNLNLSDCEVITNLESLATLSQLRTLNLSNCKAIMDGGLKSLATLPQLRDLDLSSCNAITDAGLISLATLPQLRDLNLSYCDGITDAGVEEFAQIRCDCGLPNVEILRDLIVYNKK